MITLGIETSGHQGSVALVRDGQLLGEKELSREGRRHARTLVPELRDLLQEATLAPAEVDTLAVSVGPGSFTGLRIGVACAKTWAYATGGTIVAIDTLLAIAHQADESLMQIQVISDAQRGELFVGRFRCQHERTWIQDGELQILAVDAWIARLQPGDVVSGPALGKLAGRLPGHCQMAGELTWHPHARTIATLGELAALRGTSDDVWTLEPRYLRRSAAEEKADGETAS